MSKKPVNPAKVNIKNVGSFLQGYARMFTDAFGLLEDHKKEQVVWRSRQAKECMDAKHCTYCGCSTPGKFYSDGACEDPVKKCYPEMMNAEDWEVFKQINSIVI